MRTRATGTLDGDGLQVYWLRPVPPIENGQAQLRFIDPVNLLAGFDAGHNGLAAEQAVVANATGMRVLRRGMLGPTVPVGTPIREAASGFPVEELLAGPGVVDYVVGAEPAPGVFLLATCDHPTQRHYLNLYKLGEGPLYCFYTPYHLCHFEVPNTIARAALFGDAALTVTGPPTVSHSQMRPALVVIT